MTATRHIIGLGNWRWWAFMSKWETTHGAAAAHTYMYVCVPANYDEIWGNKIITSGFKLLLLLLAHSTVCWWCSWRKYRWITPKRFLIFVCELDGRGVPPIPSSIIISPREQEYVHRNWDSVRFAHLHLSIGFLPTPSQNSVLNYNHTLICPLTLLVEEIFWCITLWTLLRGKKHTHSIIKSSFYLLWWWWWMMQHGIIAPHTIG